MAYMLSMYIIVILLGRPTFQHTDNNAPWPWLLPTAGHRRGSSSGTGAICTSKQWNTFSNRSQAGTGQSFALHDCCKQSPQSVQRSHQHARGAYYPRTWPCPLITGDPYLAISTAVITLSTRSLPTLLTNSHFNSWRKAISVKSGNSALSIEGNNYTPWSFLPSISQKSSSGTALICCSPRVTVPAPLPSGLEYPGAVGEIAGKKVSFQDYTIKLYQLCNDS